MKWDDIRKKKKKEKKR